MKYDVWFCHCGTIQLMPSEYYDWLAEDSANRYIIRVCQHCGATQRVWLEEDEEGYSICASDVEDFEISSEDANCKVIFSKGIRVPMKSGEYAEYYRFGVWSDSKENGEVDTIRLIQEVNDEETLRSISSYLSGIDWDDTPYALKV